MYFLQNLKMPVVISNINFTSDSRLLNETSVTPSKVITVDGVQIGIVGYLTPETMVQLVIHIPMYKNYFVFLIFSYHTRDLSEWALLNDRILFRISYVGTDFIVATHNNYYSQTSLLPTYVIFPFFFVRVLFLIIAHNEEQVFTNFTFLSINHCLYFVRAQVTHKIFSSTSPCHLSLLRNTYLCKKFARSTFLAIFKKSPKINFSVF